MEINNNIYISTTCVKTKRIGEAVTFLAEKGIKQIELTGGTDPYDNMAEELSELKVKYDLGYMLHGYFPPPDEHFVVNLASQNDEIVDKSIEQIKRAIDLSKKFGADRLGFHAGFFNDLHVSEIGKTVRKVKLVDKEKAYKTFAASYDILQNYAQDLKLYVENNVFTQSNSLEFKLDRPFMLMNYEDYLELKSYINFNLLLDVGHLKVSCGSLNLDFEDEVKNLMPLSDYIHLSDNDEIEDQNKSIIRESEIYRTINKYINPSNFYTLELTDSIEQIMDCYSLLSIELELKRN